MNESIAQNNPTNTPIRKIRRSPIKNLRCKNCALVFKGYFCPRCGQKADTQRFAFKTFFTESLIDSLELDRGVLATVKKLVTQPGTLILAYVKGQRIDTLNPARFLFVSGALATFISLRYQIFEVGQEEIVMQHSSPMPQVTPLLRWYWNTFEQFWPFVNEYTTLLNILSIPIFSLCSYVLFIKRGFNYIENVVLNTYIVCMQLLLLVLFVPFLELFLEAKNALISVYTLITLGYNLWAYMCFYGMMTFKGFGLSSITNALAYVGVFIAAHLTYYVAIQFGFLP